MTKLFAPLIFYISAISPGGLAFYFATSGTVGFIQQRFLLKRDVEDIEERYDEAIAKEKAENTKKPATKKKKNNKHNPPKKSKKGKG